MHALFQTLKTRLVKNGKLPVIPPVWPETWPSSDASLSVHIAIKASSNPVISMSSLKSIAATRASVACMEN